MSTRLFRCRDTSKTDPRQRGRAHKLCVNDPIPIRIAGGGPFEVLSEGHPRVFGGVSPELSASIRLCLLVETSIGTRSPGAGYGSSQPGIGERRVEQAEVGGFVTEEPCSIDIVRTGDSSRLAIVGREVRVEAD